MRTYLIIILFVVSTAVQASSTLRVGSQVLIAGDSQERVIELLGKPSSKAHRRSERAGRRRGGVQVIDHQQGAVQWRYRRNGHVTVVTIVDGRVAQIEDRRI
ncbi:MAG TPA: DUF2845 domain-containing protein [Rhodanobacter sp.]|nr:DUF2845 domain-containing protein [Rhodanobacter sp.]